MIRTVAIYAVLLALGAFILQWLDYQQAIRAIPQDVYVAMIAIVFAGGGLWIGWRIAARGRGPGFTRNEAAIRSLRLTGQELRVLDALASGRPNKEIARALGLSPNTVKTHLANLFAKLGSGTRTETVSRARELEIIP